MKYDVVILGAGAAGLMCALTAGQRGLRVLVLERANKPGKKILMSGGGKCNFTNLEVTPEHYISANPHFVKSPLNQYSQWDFIALVEEYGIDYFEKEIDGIKTGQLFCREFSKAILSMLLRECEQADVEIRTQVNVSSIEHHGRFRLHIAERNVIEARSLIVATGGLSVPSLGGSGFGYKIAEQFGHLIVPQCPALVPYTFTGELKTFMETLSGIAIPATVGVGQRAFHGGILFTHRGLSGPAVLQSSSYWWPGDAISLDLLPGRAMVEELSRAKNIHSRCHLKTVLSHYLPKQLVARLEKLWWPEAAGKPLAEWSGKQLREIAERLHDWRIKPAATEGYRTAEVTLGGVDTRELSSQTMESQKQPRLYFIGEVVDVTGHLGGYNFQWAWSSGFVAGKAL